HLHANDWPLEDAARDELVHLVAVVARQRREERELLRRQLVAADRVGDELRVQSRGTLLARHQFARDRLRQPDADRGEQNETRRSELQHQTRLTTVGVASPLPSISCPQRNPALPCRTTAAVALGTWANGGIGRGFFVLDAP